MLNKNKNNTRFRDRQSRQLSQACLKPGVPAALLSGPERLAINNRPGPRPIKAKVEYLMEYKGVKIILTDHVRDRARQRHGMLVDQMKIYFQHVINGLVDFPWEYDDQEIFVYSRAFQRGVILTNRRDWKSSGQSKCYVIVTMYPYGKGRPVKSGTRVVHV